MSVLVPGVTPEQQRATIAKLEANLKAKLVELDAKFAGRTFRAADVIDELKRVEAITEGWHKIQEGGAYDAVRRFFSKYEADKLQQVVQMWEDAYEIRAIMQNVAAGSTRGEGYPPEFVFDSSNYFWQKVYRAERAPIEWLLKVAPPTLANFTEWNEALTKATDMAANIPSVTIKWLLEQLFKSLKLPTWLIPVVGVTALVGVGAWAYFSFLAPAGAAGKVLRLRKNPRRRRRRIQRRRRR